jgi:hypothetical protein
MTGLGVLVIIGISAGMIYYKANVLETPPEPSERPFVVIDTTKPIEPTTDAIMEKVYQDVVQQQRMTAGDLALKLNRQPQNGITIPAGVDSTDELVVTIRPGADGKYGTADDEIVDVKKST